MRFTVRTDPKPREPKSTSFFRPAPSLAGERAQVINLLDLDPNAFTAFFAERGEKPFRARQVSRWLHQRFVDDVGAMSDLARPLRERLASEVDIRAPRVVADTIAADGTRKWLIDAGGANAIEAVYIPEDDRGTLCVSSQAGCALDCAFCSTGKQGFNRNLSTGEIIGQLWHANRTLIADGATAPWVAGGRAPITNVVMMGMGEPLANFDNVAAARALLALLRGTPCKVNLIPFNPFPGTEFRTSPRARIVAFQRTLMNGGIVTTIRKTRGDDIDAACGQLAGQVQDRTKRKLGSRIPVVATR